MAEVISSSTHNLIRRRRIICDKIIVGPLPNEAESMLTLPIETFGPLYTKSPHSISKEKEEAWQHLLKNSPDAASTTTIIYSNAISKVEKRARSSYRKGDIDYLSKEDFRSMMMIDGSFFLQLSLYALGGAKQLGYPSQHGLFGDGEQNCRYRHFKQWMDAMFCVGNQVPMVVLRELLAQIYFKNVIKNCKWEKPSDMSKLALYELLVLPTLHMCRSDSLLERICWELPTSRPRWLQDQQPTDVLHGLHLLMLGPKGKAEEDDEEDLEDPLNDIEEDSSDENKILFSATELKRDCINFLPLPDLKGVRGICFRNSWLHLKAFPVLYLPPLFVGDDTELIFRSLQNYEIAQFVDRRDHEICSYLLFLSKLVRISEDAKLIGRKGIIKGKNMKYKLRLPKILKKIAPRGGILCSPNLVSVKFHTSDYTPAFWTRYWPLVSLALVAAILRIVYTILAYYKDS